MKAGLAIQVGDGLALRWRMQTLIKVDDGEK